MRSLRPKLRGLAAAAAAALLVGGATTALAAPTAPAVRPAGLTRLLAGAAGTTTGIATFGAVPSAAVTASLARLGLTVQPMHHLPLALVRGPVGALAAAVTSGVADDVYPNDPIQLLDTASSNAMGGAAVRAAGVTGKGVTVAVVDSGCDASHPDLADHVVHNVKLVGAEYANVVPDSSNTIVVPNEVGPYRNTDLGSGHGTHVAGIIAADGHTGPEHLGVAPDADLICYSIGEVLFTTAVVSAYDDMLDHPDVWGIDVVNNSWGNAYQQYDPRNPVAVATKAVADQGVTVVFAAGNSGSSDGEASLNPFSQSPWVLSVAAGTVQHARGEFSSNGFRYDNSQPVGIGAGGHTTFTGNRLGLVHPDVTGPGVDISSTCDSLGTLVGPCAPGDNTTASGTSMASPHVAGAAAALLQARPGLTPEQVRQALQVTATPVTGTDGEAGPARPLGFWQVGYGYVDLGAAVKLVQSATFARDLPRRQAAADQRVLAGLGRTVVQTDLWTYDAPRVALGGSDHRTYTVAVKPGVRSLGVVLAHPSLNQVGVNGFEYVVTVKDATGRVVGTTTENPSVGTSSVLVDGVRAGTYTVEVEGRAAVSDPDTLDSDSVLGDTITLQLAQLR
jgi:serine protease AprX